MISVNEQVNSLCFFVEKPFRKESQMLWQISEEI